MPFKKGYKRRPTRKRGPGRYAIYSAAGSQLARDVMKLKGLINVEFKQKDTTDTLTPDTTGSITYLNLVAQGDTNVTRDGSQFRCKSVQIYWSCIMNALGTNNINRVILGIHKNVNSTTLTAADVLEAVTPTSPRRYDNQKNVIVLKDWFFSQTSDGPNRAVVKKWYSEVDLITRYQLAATAAAVAGLEDGGIFLLTVGDSTTNDPVFQFTSRVRYIDN